MEMKWMRLLLLVSAFVVGCAYQAPYVIGPPPDISPPPTIEKQPPIVVEKSTPAEVEKVSTKAPPPIVEREPWRPSPTMLYGDPSRGYVHNLTENKFIRGWWMPKKTEARPSQPPDFELPPGGVKEFFLSPPGKHWLYIEGYYFTQRGEQSAGWNTFQVEVTSRINYDGWYGWRVVIYDGHFRY